MKKPALLTAFLFFLCAASAFAWQRKMEMLTEPGEGTAVIEGGDYIDARQKAASAAMRDAVMKAVAALSSADQAEKNLQSVDAIIAGNPVNFMHSYKFSDEKIDTAKNSYVVSMECTFFAENLSAALENIGLKVAERPKAVVVVDERGMEAITASSFLLTSSPTENSLKEAVEDNGFRPIGRLKLRSLKKNEEIIKAVGGDAASLKWLSSQYGAEFVIVGATSAVEAGGKTTGTVAVKVFDGASAELIWSKEISDQVDGANRADKFRAIRDASDKMKEQVAEYLFARTKQARPEQAKPEQPKPDPAKSEQPKAGQQAPEAPKTEPAKPAN